MNRIGPEDYRISLRIRHPHWDLTEVCAKLGLVPNVIWKAGDERRTSKGRVLPGTRESSYCAIRFDGAAHQSLSDAIDFIANSLMPHRSTLNEVCAAGGGVGFYVSLFPSENAGETISASIVEKLADLKISMDLDVYPPIAHDGVGRISEA